MGFPFSRNPIPKKQEWDPYCIEQNRFIQDTRNTVMNDIQEKKWIYVLIGPGCPLSRSCCGVGTIVNQNQNGGSDMAYSMYTNKVIIIYGQKTN